MKKISKILGLTLLALATKTAIASPLYDQSNTFYIPFSFGQYFPQANQHMNNSNYTSIGVGYNFTNIFAVQTQVGFTAPDDQYDNKANHTTIWTVEGRINAANHTPFTPYLVAGLGTITTSGTQFIQDAGLGIDFKLSPTISIGLEAKEIMQESPSWRAQTVATGNFTWYFGGNKKTVQQPAVQMPVATEHQQMLQTAQTTLKPILPNGVNMCKDNKLGNQAGCVTFDNNTMIMHLNIKFQQNKVGVQDKFNTSVASLGAFMNAYPNTKVVLYGYASSEGPTKFNQAISEQRATQVKQYLVETSKIKSSRIQIMAMGTKNPVASNANLNGRQTNRRVEAKVPVPYKADH